MAVVGDVLFQGLPVAGTSEQVEKDMRADRLVLPAIQTRPIAKGKVFNLDGCGPPQPPKSMHRTTDIGSCLWGWRLALARMCRHYPGRSSPS